MIRRTWPQASAAMKAVPALAPLSLSRRTSHTDAYPFEFLTLEEENKMKKSISIALFAARNLLQARMFSGARPIPVRVILLQTSLIAALGSFKANAQQYTGTGGGSLTGGQAPSPLFLRTDPSVVNYY